MPFFNPLKFFRKPEVSPVVSAPDNGSQPVGLPFGVTQAKAPSDRKRGRKTDTVTNQDMDRLLAAIQSRGAAIPGDLAQELGWARSTLAYNLKKLRVTGKIVRVGGGRSIRYRITQTSQE
jgi:biotin operon repressor